MYYEPFNKDYHCVWLCYVTHMNESCHTYGWVGMLCTLQYDVLCTLQYMWPLHMKKSCHTYVDLKYGDLKYVDLTYVDLKYVVTSRLVGHFQMTHTNETCHTYEWIMPHVWMSWNIHVWMSHATHMNESEYTCMNESRDMSHVWMRDATRMNESEHTRINESVMRTLQ